MKKLFLLMLGCLVLAVSCSINNADPAAKKTDGEEIKKEGINIAPRSFFSDGLQKWINEHNDDDETTVLISLVDDTWKIDEVTEEYGEASVGSDGIIVEVKKNGRSLPVKSFDADFTPDSSQLEALEDQRVQKKTASLQSLVDTLGWGTRGDEGINPITLTSVEKKLTKKEILALQGHDDIIAGVELEFGGVEAMTDALADMRMDTHINNGLDGTNIGIYMHEAAGGKTAKTGVTGFDKSRYTSTSSNGTTDHATFVALQLLNGSPDAHIYNNKDIFPTSRYSKSPKIYVSSHSWVNTHNDTNTYKTIDRDFDNDVYNNRTATFVAAGNSSTYVSSPGKAYNVVTVGGYNDANDTMITCNYKDPETGMDKPELVAPGDSIDVGPYTGWTGTSMATPLAAAFAANLMERYTWLKEKPYLVKATMMAGANHNIEGASKFSDKDGAGAIDFQETFWTKAWWWSGSNGSYFDSNKEITVTYYCYKGRKYRAVLSWLVPGSYAYSNNKPNMDIDLRVYKGSTYITGSAGTSNNHEIVEFTPTSSGTYTFKIKRYWNSGTGNIRMGLALNQFGN